MPQVVQCRACAKRFSAPDALAGMNVLCPGCKSPIAIPGNTAGSPPRAVTNVSPAATSSPSVANAPLGTNGPIAIECPHCTKLFKGDAKLIGRQVTCPACKSAFTVRPSRQQIAARSSVPPAAVRPNPAPLRGPVAAAVGSPQPTPRIDPQLQAAPRSSPSNELKKPARGQPRLLYFVFALTFLPLILQTLSDRNDVKERIRHTLTAHPEIADKLENVQSEDELFDLLPGGRIEGAHLPRATWTHWIYAAIATTVFLLLSFVLFERGSATIWQWLTILTTTATVGIVSLLLFQWIADATQGVWISGRSILVLLFYIVKFIGFSYRAAMDENYGFLASFFGFTCGVGLCEEVTKILPVIVLLQSNDKLNWRAACVLGLASGIGFGVAEGIMYSSQHYNGVMGYDIYLTRFVSCVALHATWTAAISIFAAQNLAGFETSDAFEWAKHLLVIISVPAILHGLYDTLLKRDMEVYALGVAILSFAWLAAMIERARAGDPAPMPQRFAQAAG